jgi:hypothetical protein
MSPPYAVAPFCYGVPDGAAQSSASDRERNAKRRASVAERNSPQLPSERGAGRARRLPASRWFQSRPASQHEAACYKLGNTVVRHPQECLLDCGSAGAADELRWRRIGQDLAAVKHDHAVGVGHFIAQMRGPQYRDRPFSPHGQDRQRSRAHRSQMPKSRTGRTLQKPEHPRDI